MVASAENIAQFRARQSMPKDEVDEIIRDGWLQIPTEEVDKDPFVAQIHAIGGKSGLGHFHAQQVIGVLTPEGKMESFNYAQFISSARVSVTTLPNVSLNEYRRHLDPFKSEVDSLGQAVGSDSIHKKAAYSFGSKLGRP